MADGDCDTSATSIVDSSTTDNNTGCNGTVNPAFEDTENLRTTETKEMNGTDAKKAEENNHATNGELKSPTKDGLPPAEAVNLELVTMSPYTNSIPVKKESTELDMTDPYDEYFVPVNQHKKYIRGEKLYVTQDKRENLAGSKKKCCCGVVAVLVVGAAIAILVAVLLTQESGGLSEGEARNYDKAGFGSNLVPTPPPHTPPSQPPPTTDMSQIYLKNVLEGELTIDNMQFTPGLSNSTSSEFNNLAVSLEEEIKKALFDHQKLHYGASDISVKVIEFRPGSVIVTYRVGWRFKDGIHDPSDPTDMEMLRAKLQKHLKDNDGFLYNYRIPVHSIKSNRVIDSCQIDNNGCSKGCVYNSTTLTISCTCPYGFKLLEDGKNCVEIDYMETHGFDYPSSSESSFGFPVETSSEAPESPDDHYWHHSVDHSPDSHSDHYPEEPSYSSEPESSSHHPLETSSAQTEEARDPYEPSDEHEYDRHHYIDQVYHHPYEVSEDTMENVSEDPMESVHNHDDSLESSYDHFGHNHSNPDNSEYDHPEHDHSEHDHSEHDHSEHDHSGHDHSEQDQSEHNNSEHDHSKHDHTIRVEPIFPVEQSESTKEPPVEPSANPISPEQSHEQNLGYLPEPTIIPQQNNMDASEHDNGEPVIAAFPNKTEDTSDTIDLLPPILTETSTSEKPKTEKDMQLPEYLPEYSTFPDTTQDSRITENSAVSSSTESIPLNDLNEGGEVKNIQENKETLSESGNNPNHESSVTDGGKLELSEHPPRSSEEEFIVSTSQNKEGTLVLETNNEEKKIDMDETREELIDHMSKIVVNQTQTENTPMIPPVIDTASKEPEPSSNYTDVINDLHNIEGNPFETERLNELPASNESSSKPNEHSYSDLHPTEKPIENNVIETFREAKATDFTNSTSGEALSNSTNAEAGENYKSDEIQTDTVTEASVTFAPIDPAIFVTPSNDEEKNTSNKPEISSSNSDKEPIVPVIDKSKEISPDMKNDSQEENIKQNNDSPSTEASLVTQSSESPDEVKLVKTTEGVESKLPSVDNQISEIKKVVDGLEDTKAISGEQQSEVTTMHAQISDDLSKPVIEHAENHEPTVFVTHPPEMTSESGKTEIKLDEMPMISVTKIPDLMGPFPVDTIINYNPEIEKEQVSEITSESSRDRPNVYKVLEDDSNNLNSLEDDYENENHKSNLKYQKPGKSKLLKNFNVKEIYPHHNSSEKNLDSFNVVNSERTVETSSPTPDVSSKPSTEESVNHLLSDESYTTLSPLFTSKPEASSSTTAKTGELTTKDIKSDQGLFSSEAFTTTSPLFDSVSSSQPTTIKVEDITTAMPLIFDLIEGKKIDPNTNEFETVATTMLPMKESTEKPEEVMTNSPETDLMSETTPISINPDEVSKIEMNTEIPTLKNNDDGEPNMMTTVLPDEMNPKSSEKNYEKKTEVMSEPTTVLPSVSSETSLKTEAETIKPDITKENSEIKEPSTEPPVQSEISDPVVKLLMNSTYPNSTLYSKCASGQWACLDGSGCIAPNSRCDSDKDCLDGSDEANCQEQGCPGNFQCASGECLKRHLVCDSVPHCSDGSDESNCDNWKCNFDEMQCLPSSRKCIPALWKCDNVAHCPNNEDEYGCKDSCLNDEFFCPEGWCIPLSKKCDGKSDCAKGEDELNCPA